MPICQNCNREFPNRKFVNGKEYVLHKRKYCPDCNPIGERRFWAGKKIVREINGRRVLKIREYRCKTCGKTKRIKSNNNECPACKSRRKREERKQQAVDLLGGKCSKCGYDKCRYALVFHHRDPLSKDFTISWNWEKSWNRIEEELKKCVLLCCRCHIEKHFCG